MSEQSFEREEKAESTEREQSSSRLFEEASVEQPKTERKAEDPAIAKEFGNLELFDSAVAEKQNSNSEIKTGDRKDASKPATPDVSRAITNLDSSSFDDRKDAQKALHDAGPAVLPQVRKALENPVSPEQRKRLERAATDLIQQNGGQDLDAQGRPSAFFEKGASEPSAELTYKDDKSSKPSNVRLNTSRRELNFELGEDGFYIAREFKNSEIPPMKVSRFEFRQSAAEGGQVLFFDPEQRPSGKTTLRPLEAAKRR